MNGEAVYLPSGSGPYYLTNCCIYKYKTGVDNINWTVSACTVVFMNDFFFEVIIFY